MVHAWAHEADETKHRHLLKFILNFELEYEKPTTNLCNRVIIQTLQTSWALVQLRLAIARAGGVITFLPISHFGVDVLGECQVKGV